MGRSEERLARFLEVAVNAAEQGQSLSYHAQYKMPDKPSRAFRALARRISKARKGAGDVAMEQALGGGLDDDDCI
jgi:hypothetical protein